MDAQELKRYNQKTFLIYEDISSYYSTHPEKYIGLDNDQLKEFFDDVNLDSMISRFGKDLTPFTEIMRKSTRLYSREETKDGCVSAYTCCDLYIGEFDDGEILYNCIITHYIVIHERPNVRLEYTISAHCFEGLREFRASPRMEVDISSGGRRCIYEFTINDLMFEDIEDKSLENIIERILLNYGPILEAAYFGHVAKTTEILYPCLYGDHNHDEVCDHIYCNIIDYTKVSGENSEERYRVQREIIESSIVRHQSKSIKRAN